jgi:hypothetical protein
MYARRDTDSRSRALYTADEPLTTSTGSGFLGRISRLNVASLTRECTSSDGKVQCSNPPMPWDSLCSLRTAFVVKIEHTLSFTYHGKLNMAHPAYPAGLDRSVRGYVIQVVHTITATRWLIQEQVCETSPRAAALESSSSKKKNQVSYNNTEPDTYRKP